MKWRLNSMCRLFGLIANGDVDVRFSMLEARNGFKHLARNNPDGWGLGWYDHGKAKIYKEKGSALNSDEFDSKVKEINSNIVFAHVRKASSGCSRQENSHPFEYKNWIFAHNGTVNKKKLLDLLDPPFDQHFTSDPIDSEIYFRLIMQCIQRENDPVKGIIEAVTKVIGDDAGANFVLSDGVSLYGFRGGRSLFYLERRPDSPFEARSAETNALIESKRCAREKAFVICSEKLTDEDWHEVGEGELIVVDKYLKVTREKII